MLAELEPAVLLHDDLDIRIVEVKCLPNIMDIMSELAGAPLLRQLLLLLQRRGRGTSSSGGGNGRPTKKRIDHNQRATAPHTSLLLLPSPARQAYSRC